METVGLTTDSFDSIKRERESESLEEAEKKYAFLRHRAQRTLDKLYRGQILEQTFSIHTQTHTHTQTNTEQALDLI